MVTCWTPLPHRGAAWGCAVGASPPLHLPGRYSSCRDPGLPSHHPSACPPWGHLQLFGDLSPDRAKFSLPSEVPCTPLYSSALLWHPSSFSRFLSRLCSDALPSPCSTPPAPPQPPSLPRCHDDTWALCQPSCRSAPGLPQRVSQFFASMAAVDGNGHPCSAPPGQEPAGCTHPQAGLPQGGMQ